MPRLAALGFALLFAGCGGGAENSPPVSVSIIPTAANVHVTNRLRLTATVHNSESQAVDWEVSGLGCEGPSCGVIIGMGVYTAPSIVPSRAEVTITARASADAAKSAVAKVTILPAIVVTVSPVSPNVRVRQTQQFTAAVRNATNSEVTWAVAGSGCQGPDCGTVDANGLYTAPQTLPSPATVTVTATSVEDTTKADAAAVMIVAATIASSPLPSRFNVSIAQSRQFLFTPQHGTQIQTDLQFAQRRAAPCSAGFESHFQS